MSGYVADTLAKVCQPPPGTWWTPAEVWTSGTRMQALESFVRAPHDPQVFVVSRAPNSMDADGDTVRVESWYLPVVGGEVSWDQDRFPQGQATIEVAADLNMWEPGPPVVDQSAVGGPRPSVRTKADGPTLADGHTPWALVTGAIVSVYYGWVDVSGRQRGLRVFDGMVVSASASQPSNMAWTITAHDFTGMLDRVAFRFGDCVSAILKRQGAPDPGSYGSASPTGNWYTQQSPFNQFSPERGLAVVAREASEFYWVNPAEQADVTDGYGMFTLDDRLATSAYPVDGGEDLYGKSGWQWIEEWMDAAAGECYTRPGEPGVLTVRPPRNVQDGKEGRADADLPVLDTGSDGLLVGWQTSFGTAVNRLHYALHARKRRRETSSNAGQNGRPQDSGHDISFTYDIEGLKVTVTMQQGDQSIWGGTQQYYVHWGDGHAPQLLYRRGERTAEHIYMEPGTYKIQIRQFGSPVDDTTTGLWDDGNGNLIRYQHGSKTVTLLRHDERIAHGFWNRFQMSHPAGVRRSGRTGAAYERQLGPKKFDESLSWPNNEARADDAAERMAERVALYNRNTTLTVVPMPWLMPRYTTKVDFGSGVKPTFHLVRSMTLPLNGDPMTLGTITDDWGPPPGSVQADIRDVTVTVTDPATRAVSLSFKTTAASSFWRVVWGDGSKIPTTAVAGAATITQTHTYATDGEYWITIYTDGGQYARKKVVFP